MKRATFLRIAPCLVVVACTPLLAYCGGEANPATETGNPPAVQQQKLHIVLRGTGVEVVGDTGAVRAGALVSVTNRTSGDHAEATALADGSVKVSVPGSLQDEYDVTVSSGADSQTVRVAADTAPNSAAGDAAASCGALEATLGQLVVAGFSAGAGCQADIDCAHANWDVGCYSQCGGTFVTTSEVPALRASVEQSIAPICAELTSRCTLEPASSCPPPPDLFEAECYNGACRRLDRDGLSCADVVQKAELRARNAVERVPHDCASDTDCAVVSYRVRCVEGCGALAAVPSTLVESVSGEVRRAESYFCSQFDSKGCPAERPLPCGPAPEAVAHCQAGKCEIGSAR